jgi:hypothetical protein
MRRVVALLPLLVLGLTCPGLCAMDMAADAGNKPDRSAEAQGLRSAMRALWVDHVIYTRSYIVSALAALPDEDAVASRLMRNQDDIGAAIVPYFGHAAGARLAVLLREHISIAAEVVDRARAGDGEGLKEAQARWAANGSRLADFLSGTDPLWDRPDVAAMLTEHLATTTAEVDARLAKDWPADIKNFDFLRGHMLLFADFLSEGIIRRFPERFKSL